MKLNEMREKTVEELQSAIVDWKKDLFNYKLQLATHKLENTALIAKTKKLLIKKPDNQKMIDKLDLLSSVEKELEK